MIVGSEEVNGKSFNIKIEKAGHIDIYFSKIFSILFFNNNGSFSFNNVETGK